MNLSKGTLYILGVAVVMIFFTTALWIIPRSQSNAYRAKFTDEEIQKFPAEQKIQYERNVADIEDKTRLTLAQIIGGLALLSGLYFTYQNVKTAQENLRVTEEGKLTERFSNAVELLGNEKLDVRLGGIYALERIARDSQKDHWTVMEVLTAFVRENAFYRHGSALEGDLREDIQAIMTVIGRRKWYETEKQRLNLQRVNLARCVLVKANLRRANLMYANLKNADLSDANLSEAELSVTDFRGAELNEADLNGADFRRVIFYSTETGNQEYIYLHDVLQAKNYDKAKLPPELAAELKEWQAKQAKEKSGAGEDSSEDQAEK